MPGLSFLTSVSRVDIYLFNNVWWNDAFEFGQKDDLTWDFNGKTFLLDIKQSNEDVTPLLSLSSTNGDIVVDDPVLRILRMHVSELIVQNLPVNGLQSPELDPYVYDLIMVDDATTERMMLMYGQLEVFQGVTFED